MNTIELTPAVSIAVLRGGYVCDFIVPGEHGGIRSYTDVDTVLEQVRMVLIAWDASDRAGDAVDDALIADTKRRTKKDV